MTCEGCGKRPEVYGSSWCAHCHDAIPNVTRDRIIQLRNALNDISYMRASSHTYYRAAAAKALLWPSRPTVTRDA